MRAEGSADLIEVVDEEAARDGCAASGTTVVTEEANVSVGLGVIWPLATAVPTIVARVKTTADLHHRSRPCETWLGVIIVCWDLRSRPWRAASVGARWRAPSIRRFWRRW